MSNLNVALWAATAIISVATPCVAATHRVPADFATIQQAVGAAAAGDTIRVRAGEYCGATIDKPLRLIGQGHPSIIGCADGPALDERRIGFLLSNDGTENAASGTTISGFTFDGAGVWSQSMEPLALGIFARFASDVRVLRNRFMGTVQAITNTAGDNWVISLNRISGLTLLDCTSGCAGGVGVAVQSARGSLAAPGGDDNPVNRAEDNVVTLNRIDGILPDGFDVFGMVGVLALAADGTVIAHNRIGIPDNPTAPAPGQGVLVTHECCGLDMPYTIGSRDTVVVWNDGRKSEDALVVEGTQGANTEGLVLFGNRGVVTVEGEVLETRARRARSDRGRRFRALM